MKTLFENGRKSGTATATSGKKQRLRNVDLTVDKNITKWLTLGNCEEGEQQQLSLDCDELCLDGLEELTLVLL